MSEVKVNKISPRTNCGTVTVGDSVTVTAGVPVTVNGDLKSNALKAVDGGSIISQCGTTITLGASGDTINLAAGASQTGFGRTGTVDWDTTAKTASFTAVSGNGYFVNTTSGAITLTLPSSPSAGDIVSFKDYAYTFATNNLTVAPNGSNIGGDGAASVVYNVNGTSKTFIYVDGTQGWLVTNESTDTSTGLSPAYVTATGGTITCCGDYKIHTFTGPGTFCVSCAGNPIGSNTVDYLVVAGGGGNGSPQGSGGGGAGGYRESSGAASGCYSASPLGAFVSALPVSASPYPITVGGGGAGGAPGNGNPGSNSVFSTITSTGGGGGGRGGDGEPGLPGGSGGAGGGRNARCGGTGNTPPVSPPQGQPGGLSSAPSTPTCSDTGGGGGGATVAGGNGSPNGPGGPGGAGATSSINGTPTTRAGGGGGGSQIGSGGAAGPGGGGAGNSGGGTANTGGGAGGAALSGTYAGGSGIVIIRYKYQ